MEVTILDHVDKFLLSLESKTRSKVGRQIEILSNEGHGLRFPYSKKILNRLFELRIPGEQSIRLFYTFAENHIFIISGFIKKTDKLPQRELEKAWRIIQKI